MTGMEIALRKAGVKVPDMRQRIWQWVRDNPHHEMQQGQLKHLSGAAQLPWNTISRAVSYLVKRDMLTMHTHTSESGHVSITYYRTVGNEYVLKPIKRVEPKVESAPKVKPPMLELNDPYAKLDQLRLAEMREIYYSLKKLAKIFNW